MSWRDSIKDESASSWRDTVTEETGQLESGLRGLAQGASLGFADELTGAAEALLTDKSYEQARDESRQAYDKAQAANPNTYLAGDVTGSIATAFLPGLNVAKGATTAARIGRAAAGGALSGLGTSKADNAGELAKDATVGAALGGGLQGVGESLVPASKWAGSKLGEMLAKASAKGSPTANRMLSKTAKLLSGVNEDAALRQIQRPMQTALADADDFAHRVGKRAVEETESARRVLGTEVDNAERAFLSRSGKDVFGEADVLKMKVEDFLRTNQPSSRGFSGISDTERDALLQLKQMLDGPMNGEDLVKVRDYLDHVKRLASKYDKDETGPVINFLKGLRGSADNILDRKAPDVDAANRAFAQFKDDTGILRGSVNESQAEGMINNLYGANKKMKQEAAGRLFSGQVVDAAQDISANKAFEHATRPGGDNYFRRAALGVLTAGASEVVTSANNWKRGLRHVGRLEQTLKANPQALGEYASALTTAMNRGPQALAATHFILQQRDPKYRERLEAASKEDAK